MKQTTALCVAVAVVLFFYMMRSGSDSGPDSYAGGLVSGQGSSYRLQGGLTYSPSVGGYLFSAGSVPGQDVVATIIPVSGASYGTLNLSIQGKKFSSIRVKQDGTLNPTEGGVGSLYMNPVGNSSSGYYELFSAGSMMHSYPAPVGYTRGGPGVEYASMTRLRVKSSQDNQNDFATVLWKKI